MADVNNLDVDLGVSLDYFHNGRCGEVFSYLMLGVPPRAQAEFFFYNGRCEQVLENIIDPHNCFCTQETK